MTYRNNYGNGYGYYHRDPNKLPTLWECFRVLFFILTLIVLGILGGIYSTFANTTFRPVTKNENVTNLNFREIPCYKSMDNNMITSYAYLWTLQISDVQTGDVSYGHMCGSYFAKDIISQYTACGSNELSISESYPYKRNNYMDNTIRWFCYRCETRNCTDMEDYIHNVSSHQLYLSRHATHTASLQIDNETQPIRINAHDVILDKTPYFPKNDWNALWVCPFLILTPLLFFANLRSIRDIPNIVFANKVTRLNILLFKYVEMVLMSALSVSGSIYVFKNVTFQPYTDENVFVVQVSFYFWYIALIHDLANWYYSVISTVSRFSCDSGYFPVFGIFLRLLFGEDQFVNFIQLHNRNMHFHTLMNIPQLICVAYYYFSLAPSNINGFDLAYFILLCLNMFFFIIYFIYSANIANDDIYFEDSVSENRVEVPHTNGYIAPKIQQPVNIVLVHHTVDVTRVHAVQMFSQNSKKNDTLHQDSEKMKTKQTQIVPQFPVLIDGDGNK